MNELSGHVGVHSHFSCCENLFGQQIDGSLWPVLGKSAAKGRGKVRNSMLLIEKILSIERAETQGQSGQSKRQI